MITGHVFGGDEVVKRLLGLGPKLQSNLARFIAKKAIALQRHVIQDKLTGQVLRVRTGTLRRSITFRVEKGSSAVYGIVGTNISYGRTHEYGFSGSQAVKAHLRMMRQAWGKPVSDPHQIQIRQFARKVNLPERSFLRSALNDMRGEIREGLEKEIQGTLRGLL